MRVIERGLHGIGQRRIDRIDVLHDLVRCHYGRRGCGLVGLLLWRRHRYPPVNPLITADPPALAKPPINWFHGSAVAAFVFASTSGAISPNAALPKPTFVLYSPSSPERAPERCCSFSFAFAPRIPRRFFDSCSPAPRDASDIDCAPAPAFRVRVASRPPCPTADACVPPADCNASVVKPASSAGENPCGLASVDSSVGAMSEKIAPPREFRVAALPAAVFSAAVAVFDPRPVSHLRNVQDRTRFIHHNPKRLPNEGQFRCQSNRSRRIRPSPRRSS